MAFTPAENLQFTNVDNEKLRIKLFAKDAHDIIEEDEFWLEDRTLPLQYDTSNSTIGSFPTSVAYWYSHNTLSPNNILSMASFVFEDDCTSTTTEPQDPEPQDIQTVPINVGGLLGTEYVDRAGSFPTQDHEWYVPYKFYSLTKVRVWRHSNVMSGFEVTFSPDPDFLKGYEDITHMFGSEGLTEYTEPFVDKKNFYDHGNDIR